MNVSQAPMDLSGTSMSVRKMTDGNVVIWSADQETKDTKALYIVLAGAFALWCCC